MPRVSVRLDDEQFKEMEAAVEDGTTFSSHSHYIRRAIEEFQSATTIFQKRSDRVIDRVGE